MSKRKVTRRQAWRIQKIQQERADRAQKRGAQIDQQLTEGELGEEREGLIIAHYGTQVDVETIDGDGRIVTTRCHLRTHLGSLVTGDRVIWREGKPTGVVVACMPRHSELARPDSHGQMRPIAANIDYIVLVIAPLPQPHGNLIDRYLVAAESVDIEPLLLLNKTDLLPSELISDSDRDSVELLLSTYRKIGYRVIGASTRTQHGLDELKTILRDRTSVFVGQSGVGKSSLIGTLLPGTDLRIGDLSQGKAKGMHTTTTARLYHLPEGGELVDSPGIREFGLWHMQRQQVLEGFVEFRPFLGHCRFRDCKHQGEPDCALLAAVARGEISRQRLESFESIAQSLGAL